MIVYDVDQPTAKKIAIGILLILYIEVFTHELFFILCTADCAKC